MPPAARVAATTDRFTQFEQPYQLKAGEFLKGYAAFDARERPGTPAFPLPRPGGDGDVDMLAAFRTRDTGLSCASGYGFVTAQLYSGQYISGSDTVNTDCR